MNWVGTNRSGNVNKEILELVAHHVPLSFGPTTRKMFCHGNLVHGRFMFQFQSLYPFKQNSNKITISIPYILYISMEVGIRLDLFLLNCPSVYSVHVYKNTRRFKLEHATGGKEEEDGDEEETKKETEMKVEVTSCFT